VPAVVGQQGIGADIFLFIEKSLGRAARDVNRVNFNK
jgi:hypothetical protein